jgi:hypothetical protein
MRPGDLGLRAALPLRGAPSVAFALASRGGSPICRAQLVEELRCAYRRRRLRVESDRRRLERAERKGVAIDAHAVAELLLASDVLRDRLASPPERRAA